MMRILIVAFHQNAISNAWVAVIIQKKMTLGNVLNAKIILFCKERIV